MASSSTAKGSSASSSSSFDSSGIRREYDVFLSFRGEDTRNDFTYHLYTALNDRGICTFRDVERLERGKEISSYVLEAIERSSVSIIVLSKNYASSKRCLEELAKILECMATKNQKVFPVFYKVDPSDIRKQRGDFETAFHKHEEDYKDNLDKVQRWRSALTQVSALSGWHLQESRFEAEFIKPIVDTISISFKPTFTKVAEDLVGIKSSLEKINDLLESGLDDIRFIGICGMGGIGKTTIARVLYNRFSGDYQVSCFLADVREVSSKKGVVHLQEQLLSNVLNETSLNICHPDEGINYIRSQLCHKRVFVILDDVDQLEQLEKLAGKHNWFGSGSRIIVTARDKDVLISHGISSIYEVERLEDDDALQLFLMKAFRQGQPTDDHVELSKQIVRYTNGLPLALQVLGAHLCGRTVEEWKRELKRLQNATTEGIVEILSVWHLQERSEAEFIKLIKLIVDIVPRSLKPTSSKFAEDLVGKINDLLKSGLDDGANGPRVGKWLDDGANGRRVGKLFVSNKEIARGSNDTIVFEGNHEGRPAAVKRLVLSHHDDVAFKEIQNFIASDGHPNIVRWYGKETYRDFVYLSLELCICNLDDLIQMNSDSSHNSSLDEGQDTKAMTKHERLLDSVKHLSLWKANGHPSPLLLDLMKDMVSGLVHLHKLRIVHRDLKPQHVLISNLYDTSHEISLCAKLSGMGISKCLPADTSSLDPHATGSGSSGWQAPEQLRKECQTRAVDLFSLGCVLYFCITRGKHPFGNCDKERDSNIKKNQMNLSSGKCIPEAEDLISRLPSAFEVLHHPLLWSSEMRLSFVRDTSDMVELEGKKTDSALLKALENTASVAQCTKWNEKLEPIFITNIDHHHRRKSYSFDSVRDLLRVMRNKLSHYGELPEAVRELVGPVPEGFDGYFATRFPRLFIEVYKVVCRYCRKEPRFQNYFKGSTEDSGATVATETTDPTTVPGPSTTVAPVIVPDIILQTARSDKEEHIQLNLALARSLVDRGVGSTVGPLVDETAARRRLAEEQARRENAAREAALKDPKGKSTAEPEQTEEDCE